MDKAATQGMTADQIISLFKQAAVRRQFPAQFLSRTFEEIQAAARARPDDLPCVQIKKSDDLDNACAKSGV
jgi:hypothetical protein